MNNKILNLILGIFLLGSFDGFLIANPVINFFKPKGTAKLVGPTSFVGLTPEQEVLKLRKRYQAVLDQSPEVRAERLAIAKEVLGVNDSSELFKGVTQRFILSQKAMDSLAMLMVKTDNTLETAHTTLNKTNSGLDPIMNHLGTWGPALLISGVAVVGLLGVGLFKKIFSQETQSFREIIAKMAVEAQTLANQNGTINFPTLS